MKPGPLSDKTLGGKYLLGDLLGQGGFGAVYQAENQMLHRQQAVKVLLEEHFSDEKFRDRFLREARTLAALDHANIVHVDDIGVESNLIYLVMPYISGGTLQDLMRTRPGPLALEQITRYLEQICSALGYAHAQGVAHLDLKPLNLLVHHDGRLLLSDFGLAHLMEQGAIEGGTSLQFGSPLYMAPEHFDGKPTQRSDLYALGVILYQMLAGRHPFEASTPAAVMRKHLTEPPPSLHSVRPDLPVALDAVMAKALAKEPEQRYGRAGELLFDFRAALAGQALQFSGLSSEPTRLSQAPLDPTQRASQPPLVPPAGPVPGGSGPAAPALIGQPFVLQQPPPGFFGPAMPRPVFVPAPAPPASGPLKIWTPGFRLLFVLLALAGGVVTLIENLLIGTHSSVAFTLIVFLVLGGVAAACLVGVVLTRSILLRVGLLLQAGSLAVNFVRFALVWYLDTGNISFSALDFYLNVIDWYLPLILTILDAASLVVISYGLARWQRTRDAGFMVLQVLVSVLVAVLFLTVFIGDFPFRLWFNLPEYGSPFIALTAAFFAASVFLLRPACWKQQPIVTLLLGLGSVLFVIQAPGGFLILRHSFIESVGYAYILDSTFLLSWLLLLLGILLLIQMERVRRRAQQVAPIPVQVGQQR